MEFLIEYGLFLLKAVTIVVALLLAFGGIVGIAAKQKPDAGELQFVSISEQLRKIEARAKEMVLSKDQLKQWQKAEKEADKKREKSEDSGTESRLYVIDFKGSIDAKEVESLRREVTAILTVATPDDEVLVRLESGGGVVHGYGLAASQLKRITDANIKLTTSVDKVAASGGYMMACVGDHVLAAPYAIIGSIGVIAQLPNFNKVLKKYDVDFEMHTAGEYKRTLTMFGENDDQGREKFREELAEVHDMFKGHVESHRSELDIDKVATGEYWYGTKAIELGLVDQLITSDDYLLQQYKEKEVYKVRFKGKKKLSEKIAEAASISVDETLNRVWQRGQNWRV